MKRFNLFNYAALKRFLPAIEKFYPALPMLAALLGGIISAEYFSSSVLLCITTALIISCLCLFFMFSRQLAVKISVFFLLGTGVLLFAKFTYQNNSRYFPAHICKVSGQLQVTAPACCGDALRFLANPKVVRCRVRDLNIGADGQNIVLTFARDVKFPLLEYGDIVEVDGILLPLRPALQKNVSYIKNGIIIDSKMEKIPGFDFSAYLKIHGVQRLLYCKSLKVVRPAQSGDSFFNLLFTVRNAVTKRLCKGLSPEHSGMLAALFFGCRQGLNRDMRDDFIQSGTIHIFTVSGLHVALLAMFVFFILRFLPFRPRYLLTPVLLVLYVLMTGANPPALRALLMISLYCVFRALLLRTKALNIVFLAALLLLLLNPFYIFDIGFQYSFVIVIFLLLSASFSAAYLDLCGEKIRWIAPACRGRDVLFAKIKRYVLALLLVCAVASIAALPISLYHQGIFAPFAVFANFLVTPVVWLLFVFLFLKLFTFGFFSLIANAGLTFCLKAMSFIALKSAQVNMTQTASRPFLISFFVFFIALLLLLLARRKGIKVFSLFIILGLLGFWYCNPGRGRERIVAFSGGNNRVPAVLYSSRVCDYLLLFDCPSTFSAVNIRNDMRFNSIAGIDYSIICSGGRDYYRGLEYLLRSVNVRRLFLSRKIRAKSVLATAREKGTVCRIANSADEALFSFVADAGNFTLKFKNNSILGSVRRIRNTGGGFDLIIIDKNNNKFIIHCANSLEHRVNEYIFL